MKLKEQEKIRRLELMSIISIEGLSIFLNQYSNIEQIQQFSEFLVANEISLQELSYIANNLYFIDYITNFRTQRLTEEYKKLRNLYGEVIKNTCEFYQKLGISDSPIKIFAMYVYMYRSGYFSYNNYFEYSTNMKDFAGLQGVDVILGSGVCRSISSMLKDIFKNLGYESYNLTIKASKNSITKLQNFSNIALKKNIKSKKFVKIVDILTKNIPIANHAITMVKKDDKNYIFDSTNDGFLYKGKNNRILTFADQNVYMKNYFLESFFINILGVYRDGINIFKQRKQLNMSTVDEEYYKKEYLETLNLCILNEDLFKKFYDKNKTLIDNIYDISKQQNGMVRRLVPIIPNIKLKK